MRNQTHNSYKDDDVRAALRACSEHFIFAFGLDDADSFEAYLQSLDDRRHGRNLKPDWVPETFLLADVAGVVVGRISIRHELNDHLRSNGGHIGYGVLPEHRRRGYAGEILRHGLAVARDLGLARVLLTCDEENTASRIVIERHGGTYAGATPATPEASARRRYWIRLA